MSSPRLLLENAADQLPTPNGVALAIMEMWEDDQTTIKQLSKLVQTDPALSGKLLKLANSAALGGRRPVVSIPEAVVRVGMQTVGQLAVAFSLIDQTSDGHCEAFDYQGFWTQSLLMAILGRQIAAETRLTSADDLFASCLLSRVGLLAFATIYPREYSAVIRRSNGTLVERERVEFGFDHNALSYELMLDYGVPNALAEPAASHEDPTLSSFARGSRPARLVDGFHLAWRLSSLGMAGVKANADLAMQIRPLAARIGLSAELLTRCYDESVAEWHEWSKLLELPDHEIPNFETLGVDEIHEEGLASERLRAVVVGNDPDSRAICETLNDRNFEARQVAEGSSLGRIAVEFQPGLIVLGPDCSSDECKRLSGMIRGIEWGKSLYLLAQRSGTGEAERSELFRAGIDMVLDSNIDAEELDGRLAAVERHLGLLESWRHDRIELRRTANELAISNRRFEVLSLTDQLTELPNRRSGLQSLEQAWMRNQRSEVPLGLIMIDLDHFKSVNDRFGHAAGDQLLIAFASLLAATVRQDETVCRLGGEEFLLISAAADFRELIPLAERLRRAVEGLRVEFGGHEISISASFGLALCTGEDEDMDGLLNAADHALYKAKKRGRNCIVCRVGGDFKSIGKSAA